MDVDLRPVKKLRESAAARAAVGPILEAVCASSADLASLRVVCDWIQYKQNFRDAVVARPVGDRDIESAFDLRRCADLGPENLAAAVKDALSEPAGLALEPWVAGRDSCIWRFNALYWQALSDWERATGREYEQSRHNVGFLCVDELARRLKMRMSERGASDARKSQSGRCPLLSTNSATKASAASGSALQRASRAAGNRTEQERHEHMAARHLP